MCVCEPLDASDDDEEDEEYTVIKLQVGLFGDVRKWQKELERLSELFDTDDEESLHFILQGGLVGRIGFAEPGSFIPQSFRTGGLGRSGIRERERDGTLRC